MAAFEYAMAAGCDGFELDVRHTRDRRAVLCHDANYNRREVATTDYSGLERRTGYNLSCLEDVLKRFGATAWLDIEVKVKGQEESIVNALRAQPPKRGFVVSSFLPELLLRLHEIDPDLPLGYICEDRYEAELWTHLPITAFIPQHPLVTRLLVEEVHARKMQLLTWTVNRPRDLLRLASWGIDGLISDDPNLLAATFKNGRR